MSAPSKADALYVIGQNGTNFTCGDCALRAGTDQCRLFDPSEKISFAHGSCNYWLQGPPSGGAFISATDKKKSGYMESPKGFSCARCNYFRPEKSGCHKLETTVRPTHCCSFWEPAPLRYKRSDEALRR